MSSRVTLNVNMELLSDAIFGSGHSIPGGEDVAVCTDGQGWPYLKGTTLKGLLRESVENWLDWTGGDADTADLLFGREGWNGEAQDRRLQFTALTLEKRPDSPEDCFDSRIFTRIKDGVVETGSLREAVCICRGLCFTGQLMCAEEDVELLLSSLACIKWAGTHRNRGFGRICVSAGQAEKQTAVRTPICAPCLRYRLHTELPVAVTDLNRSYGNDYETRGWIPGSALRGLVVSALARSKPDWFAEHKGDLLRNVKFLDAVPNPEHGTVLPSIKGFYEDKAETRLHSVLEDGLVPGGMKRAKLGTFSTVKDGTIRYWSARTDRAARIRRETEPGKDDGIFQTRYLEAGQDFDGYILLEDPAWAGEISRVLPEAVWLGADRYEGFGKCSLTLEAADRPDWQSVYGYARDHIPGTTLYLLAVSPFTMLNEYGEPCGLDLAELSGMLGVELKPETMLCATSMSEYDSYNRTWQCREPLIRMYDRGSIFRLECESAPELERLLELQHQGLGVRKAEGFGQILFLRPDVLERVRAKQAAETEKLAADQSAAELRRRRYSWIEEICGSGMLTGKLSRSQLGNIQRELEKAAALGGGLTGWKEFVRKNCQDRGARHADRFEETVKLINEVLDGSREAPCGSSTGQRLELLIQLIDHSRKEAD